MLTENKSKEKSDLEFFRTARQGVNKTISIAIAIIVIVAVIAMTGVYYEYW